MKVPLAAATPLLSALLWTAALLVDPGPLAPGSVLLVGLGLLETATVSVVGMIMTGGRWARRLAVAGAAPALAVGAIRPIDVIWIVALAATGVTVVSLFTRGMSAAMRRRPAAAGPPARAVILPLALILFPALLGLAAWDNPTTATMIVGLSAPIAAMWYSRVLPGGLFVIRVLWPALAIGLAATQSRVPGLVSALTGLAVAVLAWHPSVRLAFHPPREVGTSYPIPPELAPKEVLDAAKLDEQGKPRR